MFCVFYCHLMRKIVLYSEKYDNWWAYTPCSLCLCATLDAWCFAPCCAPRNARGAIFLGSLASKLADSLCVDYRAQVTTPWLV